MSPELVAAIIAASVSLLTLIGSVAAQIYGIRRTSRDTEKTRNEQREQLDKTLAEQSKQLDRTLAEQRVRTLNERFATAAGQLGDDHPAVRLAGVYAMAGLADDWKSNRQTCVDVLCAYLRMPYEPAPVDDAPESDRQAFRAAREVRHTVIRVITARLQPEDHQAATSSGWRGLDLDFTGAVLDGGDFSGAAFTGGTVSFDGAEFTGEVSFDGAKFTGGTVSFDGGEFTGGVGFYSAAFTGGTVSFDGAKFTGEVDFNGTEFSDGEVRFNGAEFTGEVDFGGAEFSGGEVRFNGAEFTGGEVRFSFAKFSGGEVLFDLARFSGGEVRFNGAKFTGGRVSFIEAGTWSHPPLFDWNGKPPMGVMLRAGTDDTP